MGGNLTFRYYLTGADGCGPQWSLPRPHSAGIGGQITIVLGTAEAKAWDQIPNRRLATLHPGTWLEARSVASEDRVTSVDLYQISRQYLVGQTREHAEALNIVAPASRNRIVLT